MLAVMGWRGGAGVEVEVEVEMQVGECTHDDECCVVQGVCGGDARVARYEGVGSSDGHGMFDEMGS
jgi:hypothetical protein